jgi:hypothetical protein
MARNEAASRGINEEIEEAYQGEPRANRIDIMYECARMTCDAAIYITHPGRLPARRMDPRQFAVVPEHFIGDIERIVYENDRFAVFGSLDKNEQQVDDGTYEIIDAHTFTIGDSTFRYTVTGGDTLTLEPVITRTQRRETRASRQDFTTGSWMVSVAYEGTTWKRVHCEGWC